MQPRDILIILMRFTGLCVIIIGLGALVARFPEIVRFFDRAPFVRWDDAWELYALPVFLLCLGTYLLRGGRWILKIALRPSHLCATCGYDLRASESDVCPECGTDRAKPQ